MKEIWKDIPNYKGIYQASNKGRIRTVDGKTTYTKRHGTRVWKGKIIKPKGQTYKTGYRVTLWKNGKLKDFLVARLVAFTFYEKNINNHKLTVNHKDGNRFNNELTNLELISLADNIRHAFEIGLMKTNKKTTLINCKTKEEKDFISMSKASLYLERNVGYISNRLKRNKKGMIARNGDCYILKE